MDKRRILLVEDKAIFREPLAIALRNAGYTVTCADNGKLALYTLALQVPDLLIVDLAMPDLDGLTFLGRVRGNPDWSFLPVVVLSGRTDDEALTYAEKYGVADYLVKSRFSIQTLLNRIREIFEIERRREQRLMQNPISGQLPLAKIFPRVVDYTFPGAEPKEHGTQILTPQTLGAEGIPQLVSRQTSLRSVQESAQRLRFGRDLLELSQMTDSPEADELFLSLMAANDRLRRMVVDIATSPLFGRGGRTEEIAPLLRLHGAPFLRSCAIAAGLIDLVSHELSGDEPPLRFWRHSIAVAAFLTHYHIDQTSRSRARCIVVGVCHDIGLLLLKTQFPTDFVVAEQHAIDHDLPLAQVCTVAFGVTAEEIFQILLGSLKLPDEISFPVCQHMYGEANGGAFGADGLPVALALANQYAAGSGLYFSTADRIRPVKKREITGLFDVDALMKIDVAAFCSNVEALTQSLTSLRSGPKGKGACKAEPNGEVWYARHVSYGTVDPLWLALRSMASVRTSFRLPHSTADLRDMSLVVASPSSDEDMFSLAKVEKLASELSDAKRTLYFTNAAVALPSAGALRVITGPLSIDTLRKAFGFD